MNAELVSVSASLTYLLTRVPCVFSIAFPSPLKQTQVGFVTLQTKEWLPSLWPRGVALRPSEAGLSPSPTPDSALGTGPEGAAQRKGGPERASW